ncbi:MAG: nicotinate-nucleotide--dimethylbenzimidazole phosphoribosyltransferase [Alteromonadaceae bacterium]|nr:nicotinate-nucleotide--dimethylbenzimidazole phosphoribosyltransferase [Alteromonadaceae bacterium]
MSVFSPSFWSISPVNQTNSDLINHIVDNKTKPPGALGKLEQVAKQLAHIQSQGASNELSITADKAAIAVFAADHGVAKQGVSIAPPEVTQQMVLNFLAGGAAINCFTKTNDISLYVVDAGILSPVMSDAANYLEQSIGAGTADFSVEPAMTPEQCEQALLAGADVAENIIRAGNQVIGFGEMGIGNTSSASAILSAITGISSEETVGLGTGISHEQLLLKRALVQKGLERFSTKYKGHNTPENVLRELGGFEICQIVGAMLSCAQAGKTIVVDGFIVSVAALVATKINPQVRDYMMFAHGSAEKAHRKLLTMLDATPLLELDMRLGEGTGAALAIPLLRAAVSFFNDMATFESANVVI